ncbi:NAD(P)H-dependent oxidoreductase [Glutamicibacter nicotianae]|uniref:NAD(P)H-dependent oxidoreductase n=1 Tax=Glutamicibacter nicotianae TaxID=37929 RepID=UPI00195667F8|nr:NAD(P)H-dependent FMN reductase [Glutamicibacter nicotianae]
MPLTLPVISCSLDPASLSRGLAVQASQILQNRGHNSEVVDLAEFELPVFDNSEIFSDPGFKLLHQRIRESDGVVLAFPIYNWAPNAAVKSLIEATGATGDGRNTSAWFDKVVSFVCSAGLPHSYMATTSLAGSLMNDFKCVINPYSAYFSGRDWEKGKLSDDRTKRLTKTMHVHAEFATLLSSRSYTSTWEV